VAELRVALTFDAEHPSRLHCPPGNEERLLEALAQAGARATFFVQGRWATAHPDLARAIAERGHRVGNHSHYHASFPMLTAQGLRADLIDAQEAIAQTTGADPRPWFRFPFGDGEGDGEIAMGLSSLGYRHVGWHVDPNDWDAARSADEVEDTVVRGALARGDGAIVLLHAWPSTTAQALPRILSRLRAEGTRLVTLDELFPPNGSSRTDQTPEP
jgi:peptidoglycan/xylan/chitin deacetylase (PgdA/CDA1 family)